ncbi:helix-turn-helix domain-containing protein [Bifidobacterium moukalabense]|uniref:helix-turn-helix domain-containing protein n=1 Tax=Bifidobacterium moukalabense TaxID=1333651 RepID=UPI0010F540AE|nr:helix-turn-helix domain-containing protein [Bifidobacterium moukalabense]
MTNTQIQDEWMTRKEAAAYAKTTTGTLATLAYQHRGPRMFKPSPRKVVYRRSDLDAWLTGTEVAA